MARAKWAIKKVEEIVRWKDREREREREPLFVLYCRRVSSAAGACTLLTLSLSIEQRTVAAVCPEQ